SLTNWVPQEPQPPNPPSLLLDNARTAGRSAGTSSTVLNALDADAAPAAGRIRPHRPHTSAQLDCSVAETMFEETPDMRHVVDDGRLSQHALFTQVAIEFSGALLNWVRLRFGRLFHANDSLAD